MSERQLPRPPFPKDVTIIDDLATLQAVADPLRLQLLTRLRRGAATAKELARALRVGQTSLYYHLKLLEQHGLIRVVQTRLVSGIVEKHYQATAYRLSVDRALLSPDVPGGSEGLMTFLSVVLDHTRSEIEKSIAAGLISFDQDTTDGHGLELGRRWLRLTPAESAEFLARLYAVVDDFAGRHHEETEANLDPQPYELLLGFYPVLPPEHPE